MFDHNYAMSNCRHVVMYFIFAYYCCTLTQSHRNIYMFIACKCVHLFPDNKSFDSMSFPCCIMIIDNNYRKFWMIITYKCMIHFCWKICLWFDEDMLKLLQPYGFDVGQSERGTVLKGLDLGVQGMRVGGQVRTYSRSKSLFC